MTRLHTAATMMKIFLFGKNISKVSTQGRLRYYSIRNFIHCIPPTLQQHGYKYSPIQTNTTGEFIVVPPHTAFMP